MLKECIKRDEGFGFVAQLAFKLNTSIDWNVSLSGGGTKCRVALANSMKRNPKYFVEKKIIVWVFGPYVLSSGKNRIKPVELPKDKIIAMKKKMEKKTNI